jgi:hypothetical protein
MAQTIGVVAYAKRRGVSHQAVSKAIATGRLSRSVSRGSGGRCLINVVLADREWGENTDAQQQRSSHRRPAQVAMFPDVPVDTVELGSASGPVLAKAQAMRVTFLARTAELDYLEKARSLVSADKVSIEAFRVGRTVRDAIMHVPDRVSAQLAALSDEHQVHELLTAELAGALRELADAGRRG